MSDFVQTMKDWRRMCMQMDKEFGMDGCEHCPLVCCSAVYDSDGREDYAEIARKVAEWAAEHPAPKYPTWMEYLFTMYDTVWPQIATMEIPAEIAQKLGIEPKEGT